MPLQPDPAPGDSVPEEAAKREAARGRTATHPAALTTRGWFDVLWRVRKQLEEDNLSIVAAGIAFYAFVALVPTLALAVSLYALAADVSTLATHLDLVAQVLPGESMPLIEGQLTRLVTSERAAGFTALLGLLVAMYGSSNAMKALITGLNIAYDEKERRGFVRLTAQAIGMTLGVLALILTVIFVLGVTPALLSRLGLSSTTETLLNLSRWPVLLALFLVGVSFVYRYGPCRRSPKLLWASPGALLAAFLWLSGSALFSAYVSRFANYEETHGALGAVVIFLLWLYLSAFVVLLGAELNSEAERQTLTDTTTGVERPLGKRGAYAADTIGPSRKEGGS